MERLTAGLERPGYSVRVASFRCARTVPMVVSILYVPTVNQMVISEQHHLRFIISDRRTVLYVEALTHCTVMTSH